MPAPGDHDGGTDDGPDAAPTVATLYSGGKDSTLAALLLDPFYDVALCSCTFASGDAVETSPVAERVRHGVEALGRPHVTVALDPAVAREAVERMVADGYPREGIQQVHEHALETVAGRERIGADVSGSGDAGEGRGAEEDGEGAAPRSVAAVADGTRRDDRAPTVDRPFAQSLQDRHGVEYVRPLAGYGRGAVDGLADRFLVVESGPSEAIPTGDYEAELRALMAAEYGPETVAEVFPEHVQSRVVGRRG